MRIRGGAHGRAEHQGGHLPGDVFFCRGSRRRSADFELATAPPSVALVLASVVEVAAALVLASVVEVARTCR